MFKKIIISLISVCVIAGTLLLVFLGLYFTVPNKSAQASIELANQVADPASDDTDTSDDDKTDVTDNSNIYVADVYQSLTLRSQPSSSSEPVTNEGLAPLTRLEVQEFMTGTDFAYVKVLDGANKDLFGYVNNEYMTKLGEPTVRAVTQEY